MEAQAAGRDLSPAGIGIAKEAGMEDQSIGEMKNFPSRTTLAA
jgi:hypothetical protein